ncbi:MAG: TIR domain-containing protein [Lachnospiraceae bacterium]|nr:TIR domain-containing protein [Lachnospiraceae bacterium]
MAILRCKMCGGDLEVQQGMSSCTCEFCGTEQTVPKIDDENLQGLFNRANVLRMKSQFDKAEEIYEKIIQASESESEAYWGLILCKYGIEYVEDPKTYKRIPTCHRTSYDAVLADEDYKNALKYADAVQKKIYEAEAKAIDEIQKGILEISQKEEAYDVFICYKETDENGERTIDSSLANDIYYQLIQEDFKVFFAAITLEDKLGCEYEPYIFSALNTAKVMLAIGTKPEYFNAVWVKNEWSRFMKIMKKDRSKMLIPCYRDMDAYELPEEFAYLQAQDMSKIGFITDLVRGIKKVLGKDDEEDNSKLASAAPLLRRAFMFLEDGEWARADEFAEQVLNMEPENPKAYIAKLMAELKVKKQEELSLCEHPFEGLNNYRKAYRFADADLQSQLAGYIHTIKERIEEEKYQSACQLMQNARTEKEYVLAAERFEEMNGYKDSAEKKVECEQGILLVKYNNAKVAMNCAKSEYDYKNAMNLFCALAEYLDAAEQAKKCLEQAEILRKESIYLDTMKEKEYKAAKNKKIRRVVILVFAVLVVVIYTVLKPIVIQNRTYDKAAALFAEGKYFEAMVVFESLYGYKDSAAQTKNCANAIREERYNKAIRLMSEGNYEDAITDFEELDDYKDSAAQIKNCNIAIKDGKYKEALSLMSEGNYEDAHAIFKSLGSYEDSVNQMENCRVAIKENKYNDALALMDTGKYTDAIQLFREIETYKDSASKLSEIMPEIYRETLVNLNVGDVFCFGAYEQDNNGFNGKEDVEWIVLAKENNKILVISRYALDCQPYHRSYRDITWENSFLRQWLNSTFYDKAFLESEKAMISMETLAKDDEAAYGYTGVSYGNATEDRVFLLSKTEALLFDYTMECEATEYAVKNGAFVDLNGNSWWWLRSPGYTQTSTAYVTDEGTVSETGDFSTDPVVTVRPALWMELNN